MNWMIKVALIRKVDDVTQQMQNQYFLYVITTRWPCNISVTSSTLDQERNQRNKLLGISDMNMFNNSSSLSTISFSTTLGQEGSRKAILTAVEDYSNNIGKVQVLITNNYIIPLLVLSFQHLIACDSVVIKNADFTGIKFTEVEKSDVAHVNFMFIKGIHADQSPFYGSGKIKVLHPIEFPKLLFPK